MYYKFVETNFSKIQLVQKTSKRIRKINALIYCKYKVEFISFVVADDV